MNRFDQQITFAVESVEVLSQTAFSWLGQRFEAVTGAVRNELSQESSREFLLYALRTRLYNDFYTPGAVTYPRTPADPSLLGGEGPLAQELSAANSGEGYLEAGWQVMELGPEQLVLERDGLSVSAELGQYIQDTDIPVKVGATGQLRFPKEFMNISPGYYMALGNNKMLDVGSQGAVRLYWNTTPAGAVGLVRSTTNLLNGAQVPFQIKALNNPEEYTRCDAVVLYIRKADYQGLTDTLTEIYRRAAPELKVLAPSLTKALAGGVGLAEDPGQGYSYGLHRCQIIAEGIIQGYESGKRSTADRVQVVRSCFAELGISLESVYLSPGSTDIYTHLLEGEPAQTASVALTAASPLGPDGHADEGQAEKFLDTADKIGQELARNAVWHGDRCNWLGLVPATTRGRTPGLTTYGSLGPDLYSGTAGVAVFLAELASVTNDNRLGKTAIGAIKQAISRMETVEPAFRLGFYTGWTGVAFAAARIGQLLEDENLLRQADPILESAYSQSSEQREFDLLTGDSGAIVAWLRLAVLLDQPLLVERAARLGDLLVESAEGVGGSLSWRSNSVDNPQNLTGFSHGAAGAGFALVELFEATKDSKYREAADAAFSYERDWFDAQVENWPDFRRDSMRFPNRGNRLLFSTAWCHGAAGIALSRLRAYEVLGDDTYKMEALTALSTTAEFVKDSLSYSVSDFCLCHGMAGNAEILLHGQEVLGPEGEELGKLCRQAAMLGIQEFESRQAPWPLGVFSGGAWSLFLGTAGIGHFYLRLYDGGLPSMLFLPPIDGG